MEPNKFTLIDEIDSKKDSLKIKVRIIRMWKQPYTTDLILMDEKGQRIHAAVKKQLIPTFEPLLEQGLSVVITKFRVAENGGQYPILKHPFKLNFYRHTTVKRCHDFQGSLYGFRFVPFPNILNKEVDATEDVDVIGNVVSCGNLDVYNNRNGKEQKRMTFELQDFEGNVVSCTLWDGFAQQLADFVNGHEKDDYVIIIIQLGKVREWKEVGNGTLAEPNDGEVEIEFPDELIIKECVDPAASIVSFAYNNILDSLKDDSYFQDRAILAPTHEIVDTVNDRLLSMIPGEEKVYLSSDNVCESEQLSEFQEALFSPDYLNSLKFPGLPHHRLALKVGVPIMLLRNIDQPNGLCNGTRLQVTRLGKNVIEAKIITGTKVGEITLIPRMRLTPSDKRIPFKIVRKQFPVTLCFAMTINKSQGQSLARVGMYLPRPVFTHGQLYVAVSRVTSKDGLKIVICDGDGNTTNKTTNVVYKEVLQKM